MRVLKTICSALVRGKQPASCVTCNYGDDYYGDQVCLVGPCDGHKKPLPEIRLS